jgi:hypothetical protein
MGDLIFCSVRGEEMERKKNKKAQVSQVRNNGPIIIRKDEKRWGKEKELSDKDKDKRKKIILSLLFLTTRLQTREGYPRPILTKKIERENERHTCTVHTVRQPLGLQSTK